MEPIKEIQKNAMRELAWKELIRTIRPLNISKKEAAGERVKTRHHPAIITNQEFGNWEVFG